MSASPNRAWLSPLVATLAAGCGLVLDLDPADRGRPDAGARDGGACVARAERCNDADDDCDGVADEGFDRASDVTNCGGCGRVCPSEGGVASCAGGFCTIVCDDSHADCDADPSACEADLSAPSSCGGCAVVCPAAAPLCLRAPAGFTCAAACEEPFARCDAACVDLATDRSHCGACGNECFIDDHGTIRCVGGDCTVLDCGDGRADCNLDASDGCERSLATATDCGVCGRACGAAERCLAGACVTD